MSPFEAYQLYAALKSHFSSESYDFIKYNGKVKANQSNFETRKDRFFFAKLAKRKDAKDFLIANFIVKGSNIWIGDLVNNADCEKNFSEYKKRTQALGYNFEEDLKQCLTNFDENVIVKEHQHPFLLKLFLRKKIAIETIIILNELTGFFAHWNKQLKDDIVWKDIHLLCVKYRPFLSYDSKRMRSIALNMFENNHSEVV